MLKLLLEHNLLFNVLRFVEYTQLFICGTLCRGFEPGQELLLNYQPTVLRVNGSNALQWLRLSMDRHWSQYWVNLKFVTFIDNNSVTVFKYIFQRMPPLAHVFIHFTILDEFFFHKNTQILQWRKIFSKVQHLHVSIINRSDQLWISLMRCVIWSLWYDIQQLSFDTWYDCGALPCRSDWPLLEYLWPRLGFDTPDIRLQSIDFTPFVLQSDELSIIKRLIPSLKRITCADSQGNRTKLCFDTMDPPAIVPTTKSIQSSTPQPSRLQRLPTVLQLYIWSYFTLSELYLLQQLNHSYCDLPLKAYAPTHLIIDRQTSWREWTWFSMFPIKVQQHMFRHLRVVDLQYVNTPVCEMTLSLPLIPLLYVRYNQLYNVFNGDNKCAFVEYAQHIHVVISNDAKLDNRDHIMEILVLCLAKSVTQISVSIAPGSNIHTSPTINDVPFDVQETKEALEEDEQVVQRIVNSRVECINFHNLCVCTYDVYQLFPILQLMAPRLQKVFIHKQWYNIHTNNNDMNDYKVPDMYLPNLPSVDASIPIIQRRLRDRREMLIVVPQFQLPVAPFSRFNVILERKEKSSCCTVM